MVRNEVAFEERGDLRKSGLWRDFQAVERQERNLLAGVVGAGVVRVVAVVRRNDEQVGGTDFG